MNLTGLRTLVTGATGFIGGHLAKGLADAGAKVVGLVRDAARAAPLVRAGADAIEGELTDHASLRRAMEGCDLVYHLAATVNVNKPWSYYREVNVAGTEALAEAALAGGVQRFVYVSSVSVYGMGAGPGLDENSPHLTSRDAYADTKLEAERVIRRMISERGLPAVIAQPSQAYGPGDQNWTMTPIRLIRDGKLSLVNHGTGVIQPIFIDDLVDALVATARFGTVGSSYILCGDEVVTLHDYLARLSTMLDKPQPSSVPYWVAFSVAAVNELAAMALGYEPRLNRRAVRCQVLRTTFSGHKASRELGFDPSINIDEGMDRIAAWLREETS
ncbi:MAG: NAD(P)-dependent oxidoreductase [Gemmatimonadota bacterium]|nr:MAG: NAD(P)-dependent oxidoreductase [Gemmatimonadota bacterium]